MAKKRSTNIEWTEHTWNPFVGCSVHSGGCVNCYAMRQANRIAPSLGLFYARKKSVDMG